MDLGVSQASLARQLGVDPWTVVNWEQDLTRPQASKLGCYISSSGTRRSPFRQTCWPYSSRAPQAGPVPDRARPSDWSQSLHGAEVGAWPAASVSPLSGAVRTHDRGVRASWVGRFPT
ncbi:MAG: helix-turn-helix transcriptional regulator [Planctomycetes bacterium]|nr:helix-turn-helix transcriptional regulator [Planctomycetota bacterium]